MAPYILLSFLLGAVYGALFHLWRGKNLRDLVIYFLTGVMGFFLGQGLGNLIGFDLFLIGPLHVAEATTISWGSLFLIQWLKV
jgi:uncharacterized membrane protein YfcA